MSERHNDVAAGTAPRRILLAISAAEREPFFPADTAAELAQFGEVTTAEPAELHDDHHFAVALEGVSILITGWGFPRLDADRLALAPDLEIVAHAPSSIRTLVSDALWDSGIPITQGGAAMSPAVAELSLTLTLALLRRVHRMDHALRSGADWSTAREIPRAREISGVRIGVVGASRTGRCYIDACRALGAEVAVHDPYVPADDPLAPLLADLRTLVSTCDVVAVHAPATDETLGLIGPEEVAAMRDGTLVVNTARASIVDDDALYAAAAAGRIDVALDVHDPEPVAADDRWRSLPNVLLTAHVGGATVESRRRAGRIVVDEIERHLAGEPLQHGLTRVDLERMG
jgi:phosphoglycerate dehydrogenase-like enzyme